jgi:hypothetical protein
VFFVLNVGTRHIHVAGVTTHHDGRGRAARIRRSLSR